MAPPKSGPTPSKHMSIDKMSSTNSPKARSDPPYSPRKRKEPALHDADSPQRPAKKKDTGIALPEIPTGSESFPIFPDGDVRLVLSIGREYQLHSTTLRVNSGVFRDLLIEKHAATISSKARKEGVTVRYQFELGSRPAPGQQGAGRLEFVTLDAHGRPTDSKLRPEYDNARLPNPVYKHWDNCLRAFYNLPISFDESSLTNMLTDAKGMLDVAEYLRAVGVMARSIDGVFLSRGQMLYQSISKNPIPWANIAKRFRSEAIFKEGMIHLVGQWTMLEKEQLEQLDEVVRKLAEKKYEDLNARRRAAEVRLMGHYPQWMIKKDSSEIGKMDYGGDIMSWMAVSLFRHWLGQAIASETTMRAKDGGYSFYSRVAKAGQAYLDRGSVAHFHTNMPMTDKGRKVFENHLSALKDSLRTFAVPLLVNRSMLDIAKHPVEYLTCIEVTKVDYPWLNGGAKESEDEGQEGSERESSEGEESDMERMMEDN